MNIIKIFLYVSVVLILVLSLYNLVIKNISIVGRHTDRIRKLLDKDLNKHSNMSYYYSSYYYLSIFSYGVLLEGFNKSKNIQYIAYLLEVLCFFVKFVLFLMIFCDCIVFTIIINKICY